MSISFIKLVTFICKPFMCPHYNCEVTHKNIFSDNMLLPPPYGQTQMRSPNYHEKIGKGNVENGKVQKQIG